MIDSQLGFILVLKPTLFLMALGVSGPQLLIGQDKSVPVRGLKHALFHCKGSELPTQIRERV